MEILYKIGLIILSGVLGRLGGRAKDGSWYDFASRSWVRDWLCPLMVILSLCLSAGFYWIYISVYILTALSLTTYWSFLFKEDNLWFSGFMCGLALLPLVFVGIYIWAIILRAIIIGVIWGCLNKYLPSAGIAGDKRILLWRRDIVEEFSRYASLIILI